MSVNWGRRRTPIWPSVVVYVCGCVMVIVSGLALLGMGSR